jgi:spoIIIJ-associated protein
MSQAADTPAHAPRPESQWVREGRLDVAALVPALETFLAGLFRAARLDLRARVVPVSGPRPPGEEELEAEILLDGRDAELLLEYKGELLLAFEHLALRWLRLDAPYRDHIRFDSQGYRAGRTAELRLAAETAAARVRQSRAPFTFQPMDARERRILHLALRDQPGVRTESQGVGEHRAVVVYPVPESVR